MWAVAFVVARVARADGGSASERPVVAPGFVFLERFDARSSARFESMFVSAQDGGTGDTTTLVRFDAHARYVGPSGLGFYVGLPVVYAPDWAGPAGGATSLGSLQLGFGYAKELSPNLGVIVRGGLGFPTGSREFGIVEPAMYARPADATAFFAPSLLVAQLRSSVLYRRCAFFARADIGVDVPESAPALGNVNIGVGVQRGAVSLTAELTTLAGRSSFDGEAPRSLGFGNYPGKMFGAISATLHVAGFHPYAAALTYLAEAGSTGAGTFIDFSVEPLSFAVAIGVSADLDRRE